jgi:hypothetical protein
VSLHGFRKGESSSRCDSATIGLAWLSRSKIHTSRAFPRETGVEHAPLQRTPGNGLYFLMGGYTINLIITRYDDHFDSGTWPRRFRQIDAFLEVLSLAF